MALLPMVLQHLKILLYVFVINMYLLVLLLLDMFLTPRRRLLLDFFLVLFPFHILQLN